MVLIESNLSVQYWKTMLKFLILQTIYYENIWKAIEKFNFRIDIGVWDTLWVSVDVWLYEGD